MCYVLAIMVLKSIYRLMQKHLVLTSGSATIVVMNACVFDSLSSALTSHQNIATKEGGVQYSPRQTIRVILKQLVLFFCSGNFF